MQYFQKYSRSKLKLKISYQIKLLKSENFKFDLNICILHFEKKILNLTPMNCYLVPYRQGCGTIMGVTLLLFPGLFYVLKAANGTNIPVM
jgi:hypothetical protein